MCGFRMPARITRELTELMRACLTAPVTWSCNYMKPQRVLLCFMVLQYQGLISNIASTLWVYSIPSPFYAETVDWALTEPTSNLDLIIYPKSGPNLPAWTCRAGARVEASFRTLPFFTPSSWHWFLSGSFGDQGVDRGRGRL